MKIVFAAVTGSSRPQTHWGATYCPIILEIKQNSILKLMHDEYITKNILLHSLKSESCEVLTAVAADTARHVEHLSNTKHASIPIDVIIYVAGTTHMLKISISSRALQIWNQNTHHFPGSSPDILQNPNVFLSHITQHNRVPKIKAFRCFQHQHKLSCCWKMKQLDLILIWFLLFPVCVILKIKHAELECNSEEDYVLIEVVDRHDIIC